MAFDTETLSSELDTAAFVEALLTEGYGYLPFDRKLTQTVQSQFRDFLQRKSPAELKRWTLALDDPTDPDIGYVRKGEHSGEDKKHNFHWLPLLEELLRRAHVEVTASDRQFLTECERLFHACNRLAYMTALALDRECDLPISCVEELKKSEAHPAPFSRSVFRISQYDVTEDSGRAKPHRDRSFITPHAGDVGGTLYRFDDKQKTNPREIVMHDDMAAVFFGRKAEVLTNGALEAIWHGSEAPVGIERSITTFFAHANYPMQHSE